VRYIYIEDRLSLIRKALNEQTVKFQKLLPADKQDEFHRLISACIGTAAGFTQDAEYLEKLCG
jgi:hypothetical protein